MTNFVEFSFSLPINDLFYKNLDADELIKDGEEISEISNLLNINIDFNKIEKDYWNETNNIEVYHSVKNKEIFFLFDLIRDPYDQCDMITIAVRCNELNDEKVRELLLRLYKKNGPRSNFTIDYFNQKYYHIVSNSKFYFYRDLANWNRIINIYNLEKSKHEVKGKNISDLIRHFTEEIENNLKNRASLKIYNFVINIIVTLIDNFSVDSEIELLFYEEKLMIILKTDSNILFGKFLGLNDLIKNNTLEEIKILNRKSLILESNISAYEIAKMIKILNGIINIENEYIKLTIPIM